MRRRLEGAAGQVGQLLQEGVATESADATHSPEVGESWYGGQWFDVILEGKRELR